ncbi:MAG: haloacid dehalogenase [Rhodospirillales bacterium CG15_BIG_FIL_POST_REV_8_21_14_020_66_15]|nr:MAG: haloacid dehalogenase [Rhodospirillales bacterium CG15_BIG_FIL_POST_REV_8_21_14_020_66_15]
MPGKVQSIPAEDVFVHLNSRPEGLSEDEAAARWAEVGPNALEAKRGLWWLKSLARQFTNFFTLLLDVSAGICFVADHVQPGESMDVLGWALLGVSALNALFSFVQEFRAERAMEELRKFLPRRVLALRGGTEAEIAAEDLVPGDVILLREGDRVPADARLVDCHDLIINNAPLTGEAIPVALRSGASDAELTEADNLAFAGCTVLRGAGRAVVFATGFRSQFGRIAMLSRDIPRTVSPLEAETAHMVRVLTVIAVAMGLAFFAYGVVTGRSLWVNLVFMMGIIVANVPEGLLPTFTLSLAMGSLRMARRNVLVKSLNAVEALGAVHVICTDKTGTLTENRLSVTRVAAPDGTDLGGEAERSCLEAALAASDLEAGTEGWSGDPLDQAVAERFAARGGDAAAVMGAVGRHFAFDVEKRRAAGVWASGARTRFAVKGAWEALRSLVTADAATLQAADCAMAAMAAGGQRVIAVAVRDLAEGDAAPDQDALERDLSLLGFLGLEDPLRPEVPDAVATCRTAGITMIMITGDHPATAEAIARQAGMVGADVAPGAATVTGAELAGMRGRDVVDRLERGATVFARTTPEQKMKIVTALHQMGRVVAVTGDGVNDAPALKSADIGIAMGRGGTDVAREAAQVILLDDNFASIVAGIEEGRTIFGNIRKFTNYVLVSNGPEIVPYLLYMLFPVPLALTVIQILSIDLGTDIVPSMALGQEKPDPETMRQPPRSRKGSLLNRPMIAHSYGFLGLIEAAFSISLFFWVLHAGGWTWGEDLASDDPLYRSATGIALSSILLMQIGNLFGRRAQYGSGVDAGAFRNGLLVAGVLFEAVFSWVLLYVPAVATVLGTGPVDPAIYGIAWLGAPLIFGLDYARKRIAWRLAGRP